MTDFFKFEDKELDFPFYNGKPHLSISKWALLLLSLILVVAVTFIHLSNNPLVQAILTFLVTVLPLVYVCKGKISLFFRNIKRKDLEIIISCLIGYYIYAMVIGSLLVAVGYPTKANAIVHSSLDITVFIAVIIQLVGEELFKIFLLLLVMGVVYKFTNNRKLSLSVGVIAAMICFGLLHYKAYSGALLQMMLIIGIGSIFDIFVYLKTKNVFASYIMHVLTDAIPFFYFAVSHMIGG